ncbi:MAG: hypothetical protein HC849_31175, partial [Oscillatoriales cyanobacterium RU_3_3]|nr:hypothetical protein [Oscillatoriales cyanobacterium RU_3_3]
KEEGRGKRERITKLSTVNEEGGHGGTPPLRFAPTNSKLKTQNFSSTGNSKLKTQNFRTTINYQLFQTNQPTFFGFF